MENQSPSSRVGVCQEEVKRAKTDDMGYNQLYVDPPFSAKILVVEAESIVAADIRDMLIDWGFLVPAVVSSGEKAIEKAAETYPDLVLMATELKGDMDGLEAAEQIHARFGISVLYLTTEANGNTSQLADGYIQKPFEEGELHRRIHSLLRFSDASACSAFSAVKLR